MAGDYLFSQNQRRTNQSPWAPYQQPNQPPANAVDPPFSAGRTLLPDRYISRWRRNNRRVAHSSRGDAAAVVVADEGLFSARTLLPAAAPNGRRAPARAYDLTATSVELYGGAPQEVGKLLPDRARQAPRAGAAAYRQRPFFDPTAIAEQLELFGGRQLFPDRYLSPWRRFNRRDRRSAASSRGDAPPPPVTEFEELLGSRALLPARAPAARRSVTDAYDLPSFQVELYGGQVPLSVGALLPDHAPGARRAAASAYRLEPFFNPTAAEAPLDTELFSARSLLPDRYLSPWRRANRRDRRSAHSSQGSPPPVIPQQEELFGGRTQLSQPTERAWRGWTLVTESPGSTDAVQEEEAFRARQLLPQRYTSRWRRNRRRTAVSSRDSAPPLPLEETYPGRSQFSQPPLWSRRVSILVTNDEGLFTTVVPVQEDESLAGRALLSQPPIWSRKYGVLLVIASGIDFESNVEFSISKTLLPEKAPARLRAARDAYQIAPSLVELYATKTPIEFSTRLLPDRAPGRPRAARSAYQLENNLASLYAPAIVASTAIPRRTLLGVGL